MRHPVHFEPTFTFMGLLYLCYYVRPPFAAEDRRAGADTHLALWLGVKITGNGILGYTKDLTKEVLRERMLKIKL